MLPSKIEVWNTGNLYSEHGQRIGAVLYEDGDILFVDIDRGIEGVLPPEFMARYSLKERVMEGYMGQKWDYWCHPWREDYYPRRDALREYAKAHAPSVKHG